MHEDNSKKMPVLVTKTIHTKKLENGFTIKDLIAFASNFSDEIDVRIESVNGEELLEVVELCLSKQETDSHQHGYEYLCLKAQEIDYVHEYINDELKHLSQIRQALSDYHTKLRNREKGSVAANQLTDKLEEILDQPFDGDN